MADPVVIVSGCRTPMGGFQGELASLTAPELGAIAIREALVRGGVTGDDVDEVIMGNVLPGGLRQGPARQAMRKAGVPDSTGALTMNKLCGSGMKATMLAHDSILAGTNRIVVAGGMESMTNAPYILPRVRQGLRMGHSEVNDHLFTDGLEDADTGKLMGAFAQDVADQYGLTREAMDAFAIGSLTKARQAIEAGKLKAETVPVNIKTRKGELTITDDEQPHKASIEKIPGLRPAFKKDGTVTAANASSISDGASALVLMPESEARARGLKPMARIIAHSTWSQHPSEFTLAPVGAIKKLFQKTGWSADEVDLYEINEAFAMVTMLATSECGIDPERVNVHGGACASGHPVGSTGSRIIVSLMHQLAQYGKQRGVAALCIGGGEATAIGIERI
jgi:acetyl-CoA C-acetyltransferase